MKILNYGEIEKTIGSYAQRKCTFLEEVISKENISYFLNSVIKRRELEVENIHGLKVFRTFDMDVLMYNVRKEKKLSKNMLVTKNDRKMISIEETSELSSNVNNFDTMFSIYDPKTNKIEKKIRFQKLNINGTTVNKVIILNKILDSNEYDRKEYKIYEQDGKILCVKREKNDYYLDDTGVDFMMNQTVKEIEMASQNILSSIDEILHNEKVKTYTIKKREGKRILYKV